MTDLVVISLEPWDAVWRRNQHLVDGLLRADPGRRVLFVEPDHDPLHDLRRRVRPRRGPGLRPAPAPDDHDGRLWLLGSTKWLPRRVDPRQDERWARAVVRAARRRGLHRPVLWINDTRGARVLARTGWPALYDVTDDWLSADRPARELDRLRRQEDRLLDQVQQVVVCSPELASRKGRLRPVRLIPNAVDVAELRRPRPRPADLPDGRCAVYVGTLHADRLDVGLCARTARALPADATLVLVGPDALTPDQRNLLRRNGVHITGARPREAVPGYLQHADVLTVPHLVDPFTAGLDPLKRYEYAAAGRPVVSTPVAGFADDAATSVVSAERFPATVAATVARGRPTEQIGEPVPDWSERVTAMAEVLADCERPAG